MNINYIICEDACQINCEKLGSSCSTKAGMSYDCSNCKPVYDSNSNKCCSVGNSGYFSLDSSGNCIDGCLGDKIIEDTKIPLMPYTRSKGPKDLINKKEFIYDKEKDIYICPNNEELPYSTVTKEGYKIYKSNPEKCLNCPLREQCTKSKNNQKTISRHVWQEYVEATNELRYTQTWKEIYPLRKETIERIFGDCKENMCLRFTRVRGLEKNRSNALMIFTCHNLKKMALWKSKSKDNKPFNSSILTEILNFTNYCKEKAVYFLKYTTLSTN